MTDDAALAWTGLRSLVLDQHDRRKAVCDALGMSLIRVKALRLVAAEPSTLRDIAARLSVDAPYTTLVVDDLERRGLVRREPHPTDRRAKLVTATAEGRAAADVAARILNEPPPAVRALSPDDLATLLRLVRALGGEPG